MDSPAMTLNLQRLHDICNTPILFAENSMMYRLTEIHRVASDITHGTLYYGGERPGDETELNVWQGTAFIGRLVGELMDDYAAGTVHRTVARLTPISH